MSRVLAVVGLNREARIVAGPGVMTLASGGDIATLAVQIEAALTPDIAGIISIGIAGALDPSLDVGEAIIATGVRTDSLPPVEGGRAGDGGAPVQQVSSAIPASASGAPPPLIPPPSTGGGTALCNEAWCTRIKTLLPEARSGPIAGSYVMLVDAAAKAALYAATGALCVDMESHIAAAVAARRGLPFVALRFISDGADRALPKAAQAGMKPDGGMDLAAVLKSLAADPRQLPALIRTGMEAETAFRALAAARAKLGPALGLKSASS